MRFSRSASVLTTFLLIALATAQSFGAASVQFALPVNYNTGVNGANALVTVDVNGDSFPDIVAATNAGVAVLLNNGDGTYGAATVFDTGGPLSNSLAVVDLNNDGNLDIVITNMCTDPSVCHGVAVAMVTALSKRPWVTTAAGLRPEPWP
jgi:hypothetical protein